MDQLLSWMSEYTLFFSAVAGITIVLMIMSLAATPLFVASLPIDYLLPKSTNSKPRGLLGVVVQTFRNIVGLICVILGIILMFTPGPGLVVLLVGISLAEFPGKHRLLISIAIQPNVFKSLNWMRTRGGKPPFEYPDTKT